METHTKQKPFAVFDIDGTVIRWQLYHAIVDDLAKHDYIDKAVYQSVVDARQVWQRRGHEESFREYEMELVKVYHAAMKQLSVEAFDAAVARVFGKFKDQVYTYTRDLIRDLKKKDYLLFAISGSQEEIISLMADYYGFDDYRGCRYIKHDGKFTGDMEHIYGRKHELLAEMIKKHHALQKGSLCIGDSEGDIAMLEMAEQPIAFNPTKKLFLHAKEHDWKVVLERKNMIYQLEPHNGQYILA